MNDRDSKQTIQDALKDFGKRPVVDAATDLLGTLGYQSPK